MGTKTTVSFANIFLAKTETEVLSEAVSKPTVWKRYIDDVFFLWDVSKPDIETSFEQANLPMITQRLNSEIFDTETVFLALFLQEGLKRIRWGIIFGRIC